MVFDCIILGGGPAGLAAAVYLGRYLRPTLILDHKKPQTRWHRPIAHNILGFPAGIHRNQLIDWGRAHVAHYKSVRMHAAAVCSIRQVDGPDGEKLFHISDDDGETYQSKGLILALGVEYMLPDIHGIFDYAGKAIWHCLECDGYKSIGKKIVVIGADRGSVEVALASTVWTKDVTLCTNGEPFTPDAECDSKLKDMPIAVAREKIQAVIGNAEDGILQGFQMEGGAVLKADGAFVNLPCKPPEGLLKQLPLELLKGRWVVVDHRMRTNIPRCYAAGDIVANAQTQLSVAMGTGATAGIWLHKELLPDSMSLSGRDW